MDASLACGRGHANPHVTIFCGTANCGEWILFRRSGGSRLNGACIAVLIVCGLAALFLFRRTDDVWALDAFLTLCLLNAFLVALSRGRALGAAAVSTALVMIAWFVWWAAGRADQAGPSAAPW
ncbi:hypothetical protein ACFQFC_02585 [Amorphoplanes digitatis]|uniref:O-antigen ligase n=1 Tax=Actinoplanes digitatis TaxID=1868 RepID=A0A7W7HYE0_9ACTN|nr:hypothetical protein [Actinoplanes digitatis]MBB4763063.1 O-antigen ligase [Actinoplanes digitatis]GID95736.1 hypothetical protein Adi01nite_51480 [Actinoplanes digitatis]